MNSSACIPWRVHKSSIIAVIAGVLIGLGLALQWAELLFMRFLSQNAWFFSTLLSESWNIIEASSAAAQWHQNLKYWPLLLVIAGVVILFSHCPRKFHSN